MKHISNKNYCLIQGWMLDIGCSGWSELAAYALVYGFSQDGKSEFTGSISYLQEWLMCSKRNVSYIMESLVKKGLLVKNQYEINNVKFNRYKAVIPQQQIGSAKIAQVAQMDNAKIAEVVQNLQVCSAKIAPNNTIDNKDIDNSSLRSELSESLLLTPTTKNNNSSITIPYNPLSKAKPKKLDLSFVADEFREDYMAWLDYRQKINKPFKIQRSLELNYKKALELSDNDPKVFKQIIEQSIANGWIGLFELKNTNNNGRNNNEKYQGEYPRNERDVERERDYTPFQF